MKIIKFACFLILLLMPLALTGCGGREEDQAKAHNGLIDLSGWDFTSDGIARLDGEWEFYWDRLIAPGGFGGETPTAYVVVPGFWTGYKEMRLPSKGYSTYRLTVKTGGVPQILGVKIPEIYTEYGLWINGVLIDANGGFANENPVYLRPDAYDFSADGTRIEIVLQVKNSAHIYAGIAQSIELGTSRQIYRERDVKDGVNLFLCGICLSAALYHLILYIFRKKDRELLYFCALCLAVCIRSLLSNGTPLMQALPNLSFLAGSRIVTLTIPLCVASMILYTRTLYRKDVPNAVFHVLFAVNALYAALALAAPSYIYSLLFIGYLFVVGAACLMGVYVSVKAVEGKRAESIYFLIGMVFLVAGTAVDTMSFRGILNIEYILPVCLSAFIVTQAVLLAKRYSAAYDSIEKLSERLRVSLDKIMNTETAFLNAQIQPHFLYNALNAIAALCILEPAKARELILDLSNYLYHTFDNNSLSRNISFEEELSFVEAYVRIEKARFRDKLMVEFELDDIRGVPMPPLVIQPLVENAIRHGIRRQEKGGTVTLRAKRLHNAIRFEVEDDGAGIPPERLRELLDGNARHKASVGLANIHQRLTRLYGAGLTVESEPGRGTRVSFVIPGPQEASRESSAD